MWVYFVFFWVKQRRMTGISCLTKIMPQPENSHTISAVQLTLWIRYTFVLLYVSTQIPLSSSPASLIHIYVYHYSLTYFMKVRQHAKIYLLTHRVQKAFTHPPRSRCDEETV